MRRAAPALLLLALAGCGAAEAPPPHVLLVTVDTLRADHVHAYGFPGATTPGLDALAARGVLFETAVAAASFTAPSHASILSSRYPRGHSIAHGNGTTRLEGVPVLPERFRDAGYDTAAFVSNFVLRARIGLDRGFGLYDDRLDREERNRPAYLERTARGTTLAASAWLADREDDRPFFLWVHYQDPHGPYAPPEPAPAPPPALPVPDAVLPLLDVDRGVDGVPAYQALAGLSRAAEYAARYAAEVAYADHWIGELVASAERARRGRGLVIALVADHGESLGEEGYYFQHGHACTPELALVPFVLVAPGLAPQRRREPVSHVDVLPTLLELAGLAPEEGARGIALGPFLRDGRALPERWLYCDTPKESAAYRGDGFVRVRGQVELWSAWAGGRAELEGEPPASLLVLEGFRRDAPGGWAPAGVGEADAARIRDYLREHVEPAPAPPFAGDEAERLRALGYALPEEPAGGDEAGDAPAPRPSPERTRTTAPGPARSQSE
jgi:arylsulfatase A-like enzyme